mgnify:CR=1 FL=1
MRVVLVGCGSMGQKHLNVLDSIDNLEVVGVIDPTFEREGINFSSIEQFLETEVPVDFAIVATPTSYHHKSAISLIHNGIHVLIEKPIAPTLQEAEEIRYAATKHNVKVAVGHIERFNPAIVALRNDLKEQNVLTCNIKRISPYPARIQDIGVKLDLGIHDVDLVRYITGKEVKNYHCTSSKVTHPDREDTALFYFHLGNTSATILNSWMSPFRERKIDVMTEEHYYKIDLMTQSVGKYSIMESNSYGITDLYIQRTNALQDQTIAFINFIETNDAGDLAQLEDAMIALGYVLGD